MSKLRILLADDHVMLRKGLKQILEDYEDLQVTGEAGDGEEVLAQLEQNDFDALVLDIAMPKMGGVDVLKRLVDRKSPVPVLILSMYPEEQYALRMLKSGASGYLNKESDPDELVSAIRHVAKGKNYISSAVADLLSTQFLGGSEQQPHESLSDREFQVLCQIGQGKTVSQIAEALSLSVKTISTYRARILEKMGMKTNADLTRYALKHELVE